MEVSEFSGVLHAFLGLESPDGPRKVTAESLRKFAERYDPEVKFDVLTIKVDRVATETQALNTFLRQRCSGLESQVSALTVQMQELSRTFKGVESQQPQHPDEDVFASCMASLPLLLLCRTNILCASCP
jgi:hypothetical protein